MNKELKTLKDLTYEEKENKIKYYNIVLVRELKAEAIKWVKKLRKEAGSHVYKNLEIQDWIKHFFNLTEEDLE